MRHSTPPATRLRVLSQLSSSRKTFVFVLLAGAALSGCGSSSDSISDVFGMSKNAPDERQVRTHEVLAMPPDLQLRPPQQTAGESGQPNQAAQEAAAAVASQDTLSQPPAGQTPQAASDSGSQSQPASSDAPTQLASADASADAATNAAGETQDVYERLGIPKNHPDGTPKTDRELIEDLKAKRVELERAKNPSYGTIWNFGDLF